MANIKRCYNENCECNVDGCYCDGIDIIIGSEGCCESFIPKIIDNEEEKEIQ